MRFGFLLDGVLVCEEEALSFMCLLAEGVWRQRVGMSGGRGKWMRFWDKDFDRWWITWGRYLLLS